MFDFKLFQTYIFFTYTLIYKTISSLAEFLKKVIK